MARLARSYARVSQDKRDRAWSSPSHQAAMANPIFKSAVESTEAGPPHPGEILREDMMPHYRFSAAELAGKIGVALPSLELVLAEREPVTPQLAERLGATLGHSARYWVAVQLQYDLWHGSVAGSQQAR